MRVCVPRVPVLQAWLSFSCVLTAPRRDLAKGRADTASFVLTKDAIGRGVEARWASESMDGTMPAMWKGARCGDDGHEADRTATPMTTHSALVT